MTLFLGVDGGGSGCRAAVADASGRVLGIGAGGAANIMSDPGGALASILSAADGALASAGVGRERCAAVLGLAGANVGSSADWLAARLPFRRWRIESDAITALVGALGGADGIVGAIGTGSVYAVQEGGRRRQVGGWGFVLGDEASGAWIGRQLLARALRVADGFLPASPLTEAVTAELGGPDSVVAFAHAATPGDFARLAPRVAAALPGDAVAAAVVAEAEGWVTDTLDRLSGGGAPRLCLVGGLGPFFAQRLAPRYGARLVPPAGTGLDGALILAREVFADG
jgi:glucosamine kinase